MPSIFRLRSLQQQQQQQRRQQRRQQQQTSWVMCKTNLAQSQTAAHGLPAVQSSSHARAPAYATDARRQAHTQPCCKQWCRALQKLCTTSLAQSWDYPYVKHCAGCA
jgi:hypothetical protein